MLALLVAQELDSSSKIAVPGMSQVVTTGIKHMLDRNSI